MSLFWYFIIFWIYGCILGILLIAMREDRKKIYDSISRLLPSNSLLFSIYGMAIVFMILPFSIPYSINHIRKNKNGRRH